jgi:hypothetical protein
MSGLVVDSSMHHEQYEGFHGIRQWGRSELLLGADRLISCNMPHNTDVAPRPLTGAVRLKIGQFNMVECWMGEVFGSYCSA